VSRPFSFHVYDDGSAHTPDGAPHPALDAAGYHPRADAAAGSVYYVFPGGMDPDERARRRLDAHAALLADGAHVTLGFSAHSRNVAPAELRPRHPLDTLVAWAASVTRGLPGGVCLLETGRVRDGDDDRAIPLWTGHDPRALCSLLAGNQHAVFFTRRPEFEHEVLSLHAFPDPATGKVILVSGDHGSGILVDAPFAAAIAPPVVRSRAHPDHAAAVTDIFWPQVAEAVDAYPQAALAHAEGHPDPIRADITNCRLVVRTGPTTPWWIIHALTRHGFLPGPNGSQDCAVSSTGEATDILAVLRQSGIPVAAALGTGRPERPAGNAPVARVDPRPTIPQPRRRGQT
jgi:hypothetical protein